MMIIIIMIIMISNIMKEGTQRAKRSKLIRKGICSEEASLGGTGNCGKLKRNLGGEKEYGCSMKTRNKRKLREAYNKCRKTYGRAVRSDHEGPKYNNKKEQEIETYCTLGTL